MSQMIIGVFLLFGFVMVVLLFFMIVFTVALLVFARGDTKQNEETIGEGQGKDTRYSGNKEIGQDRGKDASPDQG